MRGGDTMTEDELARCSRVTLYRMYNPPRERGGEVVAGLKRMNQFADAVLYRLATGSPTGVRVPSISICQTGDWIIDCVGRSIPLGGSDVEVRVSDVKRSEGWDVTSLRLDLVSATKSAIELVALVESLYDEYVTVVSNELGTKVFFFDQKVRQADFRGNPYDGSGRPEDQLSKRRYEISNAPPYLSFVKLPFQSNKTFDNLCGPDVALIRKRVEFFVANREWYDAKGKPYQLGILMSGAAGTGKSSCIRALANFTRRHIVNVNFANIKTVTQLKKLFMSEQLHVMGGEDEGCELVKLNVPVHRRIYVLEEIDAIGSIVLDRGCQPAGGGASSSEPHVHDEITLGDILQVLDGNMEAPGRMFVITSNHPDMLDAALTRAGRIDLIVRFKLADVATTLQLYEQLHDAPLPEALVPQLPDGALSPADITEVMFRHFGDPEAVVAELRKLADSRGRREEARQSAASEFLMQQESQRAHRGRSEAARHASASAAASVAGGNNGMGNSRESFVSAWDPSANPGFY